MTSAVLYRWRLKPGRDDEFRDAWAEGTRRIHARCGSHGAALHCDENGLYWSYAVWPSEAARQACFGGHDWFAEDCFVVMQDCIEERFEEIRLDVVKDKLAPPRPARDMPRLDTGRLVLRPLQLDDAAALYPALSDPDNMRYWSSGPLKDVAAVRDYICWNVAGEGVQTWAFALREAPDTALGWVALIDRREGTAEIGYIARPDCQGRGLAGEAVGAVVDHAFAGRGLRRVYADIDPDNTASIRLVERLGFRQEGRLRDAWETHIGIRDALIYGKTRRDL